MSRSNSHSSAHTWCAGRGELGVVAAAGRTHVEAVHVCSLGPPIDDVARTGATIIVDVSSWRPLGEAIVLIEQGLWTWTTVSDEEQGLGTPPDQGGQAPPCGAPALGASAATGQPPIQRWSMRVDFDTRAVAGPAIVRVTAPGIDGIADVDCTGISIGNQAPVASWDGAPLKVNASSVVDLDMRADDPDGAPAASACTLDLVDGEGYQVQHAPVFDAEGMGSVRWQVPSRAGPIELLLHCRDPDGAEVWANHTGVVVPDTVAPMAQGGGPAVMMGPATLNPDWGRPDERCRAGGGGGHRRPPARAPSPFAGGAGGPGSDDETVDVESGLGPP